MFLKISGQFLSISKYRSPTMWEIDSKKTPVVGRTHMSPYSSSCLSIDRSLSVTDLRILVQFLQRSLHNLSRGFTIEQLNRIKWYHGQGRTSKQLLGWLYLITESNGTKQFSRRYTGRVVMWFSCMTKLTPVHK